MNLTKEETNFILMNKDKILPIVEKYLDNLKDVIWKEKDTNKKAEFSAMADEVYRWTILIKSLKIDTPKKREKFTGV